MKGYYKNPKLRLRLLTRTLLHLRETLVQKDETELSHHVKNQRHDYRGGENIYPREIEEFL